MSDTPRTDAVVNDDTITYSEGVPADFAREIERELIEARHLLQLAICRFKRPMDEQTSALERQIIEQLQQVSK